MVQPTRLPNLTPCYHFVVQNLNICMKESNSESLPDIQSNMTFPKGKPENYFQERLRHGRTLECVYKES